MPVPFALLLASAFFAVLAVLATMAVRGLWRNESGEWQSRPLWWKRSIPTMLAVGWALLVGGLATPIAISEDGIVGTVSGAILAVSLIVFIVGFAVATSAALWGRPQLVVPPHLRGDSAGT